jgi:hypothetical protein
MTTVKHLVKLEVRVDTCSYFVQFIVQENPPVVGERVKVKLPTEGTVVEVTEICETVLPGPPLPECPSCYCI